MKRIIFSCCVSILIMSCSDVVLVPDISGDNIRVLAPTDGALLNENVVTFTWEALEDAERYQIQIAKPNFADALQIVTDSITTSLNFNKALELGEYQWRVRGENSEYQTGYAAQSFAIE